MPIEAFAAILANPLNVKLADFGGVRFGVAVLTVVAKLAVPFKEKLADLKTHHLLLLVFSVC